MDWLEARALRNKGKILPTSPKEYEDLELWKISKKIAEAYRTLQECDRLIVNKLLEEMTALDQELGLYDMPPKGL